MTTRFRAQPWLWIEDGQVVWESGYGFARGGHACRFRGGLQSSFDFHRRWSAGACELFEEEELTLDEPVREYLNRWHSPQSEFHRGSASVRRLLSHSASVPLPYIAYFTFDDQLPTLEEALSGRTRFTVM